MPDGDIVHSSLAYRYQKASMQICEDNMRDDEIGHNLLNPLKEEIQKQSSEEVVRLIKKIAERFDQIAVELRFNNPIDWEKESQLIEQYTQSSYIKKTAKNLLLGTFKEQLQDIRYGSIVSKMGTEIMHKYLIKIYESQFEEKMLRTKKYHSSAEQSFVRERLEGMKDYIWQGLLEFSRQALQNGDFNSLRRPRRQKQNFTDDDLYMDLTPVRR